MRALGRRAPGGLEIRFAPAAPSVFAFAAPGAPNDFEARLPGPVSPDPESFF